MNTPVPNRDLNSLDQKFKPKVDKFFSLCPQIFPVECRRTQERQDAMVALGLSQVKHSNHQDGLAVDIAFRDDPRTEQVENKLYPDDFAKWREVADRAKQCGIDWGYDLWAKDGFVDKPHFQDNGLPFNPQIMQPNVPDWAQVTAQKMQKANIQTPPMTPVGNLPVVQLLLLMEKYFAAQK